MAFKYIHWLRSFVNICLFICLLAEFTYSEDVPYTLTDLPSSKLEVVLDGHGIYKRAVNNDSSSVNSTTAGTTSMPASTAAPTTAAPTTAAPTTASATQQSTTKPTTTKLTTPFPIDEIKETVYHKYYRSEVYSFSKDNAFYQAVEDWKTHATLDNNHRVAVTVNLPFNFRFYGHAIKNFTIATGGFLYMSPFLHKFLTATQYIAPLMANFDTRLGNDSRIYYKRFNDKYIVEWSNLYLQDQNHSNPFSFQTTLHANGTIVFAYKSVPLPIKSISTNNHPVKVGLSDAFYIDTKVNGITRRTIYEYHRIQVNVSLISQNVAVLLHPEKTCNLADTCHKCVTQDDSFDCKWCGSVQRCSDGLDWYRQEWRNSNCNDLAHNSELTCNVTTTFSPTTTLSSRTTATNAPRSSQTQNIASCINGKAVNTTEECLNLTTVAPMTTTNKPTTAQSSTLIPKTSTHKQNTTTSPTPTTTSSTKISTTETKTPEQTTSTTTVIPTTTTTKTSKLTTTQTTSKNTKTLTTAPPNPTTTSYLHTSQSTHRSTGTASVNVTVIVAHQKCRATDDKNCPNKPESQVPIAGIIVIVIILLALIGGIAGWVYYAYTHPQSASGMWLMEHRPSQMKSKLATMKFWKKDTGSGEKYRIESEA